MTQRLQFVVLSLRPVRGIQDNGNEGRARKEDKTDKQTSLALRLRT